MARVDDDDDDAGDSKVDFGDKVTCGKTVRMTELKVK